MRLLHKKASGDSGWLAKGIYYYTRGMCCTRFYVHFFSLDCNLNG